MNKNATDGIRPWEQPFWRPARGKKGILLYLLLIHILAVIGLILFPLHMQCFVNSVTPLDRTREGDSSKNVWLLGPMQLTAWGETGTEITMLTPARPASVCAGGRRT